MMMNKQLNIKIAFLNDKIIKFNRHLTGKNSDNGLDYD